MKDDQITKQKSGHTPISNDFFFLDEGWLNYVKSEELREQFLIEKE